MICFTVDLVPVGDGDISAVSGWACVSGPWYFYVDERCNPGFIFIPFFFPGLAWMDESGLLPYYAELKVKSGIQ
jgi:hypothetical protein